MSLVSASDIVGLARLCYDIYNFCQDAPTELQGLSKRIDRIGGKLEWLSKLFQQSGLGEWREAPVLKQALQGARDTLEPLMPDSSSFGSTGRKARVLAKLALSKERLRRVEEELKGHERAIDDLKMDLVL